MKLVEEFIISSEVLANALVKAGVVDETFAEGSVSHIDAYKDGFGRVDTYNIKVEKEVSLKDIKGECDSCDKEKFYNSKFKYEDEEVTDNKESLNFNNLTALASYLKESVDKINSNNSPLNVVIDIINSENNSAENFAKEFAKRINTIKPVKGGF